MLEETLFKGGAGGMVASWTTEALAVILRSPHLFSGLAAVAGPP